MKNNDLTLPKLSLVGVPVYSINETNVDMELEVKVNTSKEELNNENEVVAESNWAGVYSGDKKDN